MSKSRLNSNFTFNNFVPGNTNKLAYNASYKIAKRLYFFNPFFIYGNAGLGKTHLLNAIGNYILKKEKDKNVIYITSDEIINDGLKEIFSNKKIDVLIIDDIQDLEKLNDVQLVLLKYLTELLEKGKNIIISSNKSPYDLNLDDKLKEIIFNGLIVDIYPPDLKLRIRILKKMIKNSELEQAFSSKVLEYIALNMTDDVNQLGWAVNRIVEYSIITEKDKITLSLAKKALKQEIELMKKSKIINFAYSNVEGYNFLEVNPKRIIFDPQLVKNKSLKYACLINLDLRKVDFTDVNIVGANLSGTGAKINPQKVKNKDLSYCNLENLDLRKADFTDVDVVGAILLGTEAKINPQKVKDKDLSNCNLEGLNLSKADFTGVKIINTILTGTGANTTGAILE